MHQKTQYSTVCVKVNLQVAVPVTFNYTTKQSDDEGACVLLFADDPLHAVGRVKHINAREKEDTAPYSSAFPAIFHVSSQRPQSESPFFL